MPAERAQREPRLLRHCASCGLLDRNVSYGMSDDERCDEAIRVIGHASRGLGRNVDSMAKSAGRVADSSIGVAKGILGAVAAFFGKDIL